MSWELGGEVRVVAVCADAMMLAILSFAASLIQSEATSTGKSTRGKT